MSSLSPDRKFFRSLRFRLLLASILVELLMLTLLVANSVRLIQGSLTTQGLARVEEIRPLLNAALVGPMAQRDYVTAQEILDDSRRQEGLAYLVLFNSEGRPVASSGWDLRAPLPPPDTTFSSAQALYHTQTQLLIAGQDYGLLRYGLSTEFLRKAQAQLLQQSILIAAAEVLLSILILTALGYWLTRHLVLLTRATRDIAGGHFEARVPIRSDDEVGELAVSFNEMARNIRDRIQALLDTDQARRTSLRVSEEDRGRLDALLRAMSTGIVMLDPQGRVDFYNPAFCTVWDLPNPSMDSPVDVTRLLELLLPRLERPESFRAHCLDIMQGRGLAEASELHLKDGRLLVMKSFAVQDASGQSIGWLCLFEDITLNRKVESQLLYLAERDALTGLYNRRRLQEELTLHLSHNRLNTAQGALLFFDLDEFKFVNDTFGHQAGDTILVRVAREVGALSRRNETLCRFGGDEFALFLPGADAVQAEAAAERILQTIAAMAFQFESQNIRLTGSLGIALYPEHAGHAEELIARADAAMYQAKLAGKNTFRVYRDDLDTSREMVIRLGWNDRLTRAFEQQLFSLHFQGIYDTVSRKLVHLEALIRMRDEHLPDRLVPPGVFIPHAERNGMIVDIDRWVIREAIRHLALSPEVPPIAVNISGRSFDQPDLPAFIAGLLAGQQVAPHRLLIELTETSAVSDLRDAEQFITSLRLTGCQTCLDDFGTGFSSFAYLKHLNVDILKIDGMFIHNLTQDRTNLIFVKSIVDVARGLGKKTVAEFVENEEILAMLQTLGVDMVQGFHLDTPRADHPALRLALATDVTN